MLQHSDVLSIEDLVMKKSLMWGTMQLFFVTVLNSILLSNISRHEVLIYTFNGIVVLIGYGRRIGGEITIEAVLT